MKKIYLIITALFLVLPIFAGCGGSNKPSSSVQELALNKTLSGSISEVGEVDWYHYRAVEANSVLNIKASSNTYRSDVELLVTVFQLDDSGNKVRLYGDHAPEGGQLPADITMNIYIDTPKDIYISVRDLMDDEASDNEYYLDIDYSTSPDDNDSFSEATTIVVGDSQTCQNDSIGYIGDVDAFKFQVSQAGVYEIATNFRPFSGGTDVDLTIAVYNSSGELIESISLRNVEDYDLILYLPADEYYVLIDDYGNDDFDTASTFQICVNEVNAGELNENDTSDNASLLTFDSTVNGSIDYLGDEDWYSFSVSTSAAGFNVLNISFDDVDENIDFTYQVSIEDSDGNVLLSHNFVGGSDEYQTQVKADNGDYYLVVQAGHGQSLSEQAPYTASISVLDVDDPGEAAPGNDTIESAEILDSSGVISTGKIAFRGDNDWYAVVVANTSAPQVLEVFLSAPVSNVEYSFSLIRDDVIKKEFDINGSDGATNLKTSILVPAMNPPDPLTYYIKVSDYQGDEGDGDVEYQISANIIGIPESPLPADASISNPIYYSEADEVTDTESITIELEHNSLTQVNHLVNISLLGFNVASPPTGITKVLNGDLTTTITFPWIGGYIDYQGDQDWFQIGLNRLLEDTTSVDWYYEIQVELHVGSPGSPVEYIWKFYRDRNQNEILVDRQGDSNGFFASAGDTSPTDTGPFDITTPTGSDNAFWVGDAWEGNFYLSISDFNYVASAPDDDWGYEVPYYFKLTLIYHPGLSSPSSPE